MTFREKLARDLCTAQGLDWDAQTSGQSSGSGGDDEQDHYFMLADTAIETMRSLVKCTKGGNRDDDIIVNCLIDAALADH